MVKSENATSAGNQQERPIYYYRNPQRLHAEPDSNIGEDIVRAAWRHAESGRNDQILHMLLYPWRVTKPSVPICRGRRNLRRVASSKKLLLYGVIHTDNSANNGETFASYLAYRKITDAVHHL
jgi:hypothetical protein